jgi:geranylgeranyl pyrophosphate synthase
MLQVKELTLFNPAVTYLVAAALCYSRINELASFVIDWQQRWIRPKKKTVTWQHDVEPSKDQHATSAPSKRDADPPSISCPYDYILDIYGRNSFDKFVNYLDPNLRTSDPVRYQLALELMDAVHGGAILVDDVADGSTMRKGRKAAHLIYGSSETINRAYLRIYEVLSKIAEQKPALLPLVINDITEIHEGKFVDR